MNATWIGHDEERDAEDEDEVTPAEAHERERVRREAAIMIGITVAGIVTTRLLTKAASMPPSFSTSS